MAEQAIVFNEDVRAAERRERGPVQEFHRSLPGYAVTPLVDLPALARELHVGACVVKVESSRLGLPSFKLLGSSWALHERIRRRLARPDGDRLSLAELREQVRAARATLCTASDGNYGRSIAALAEMLGCASVVYFPAGTAAQRLADARAHGSRVELVAGSYDDAVTRARADAAARGHWYCPDTALGDAGPEELAFASDVAAGYTTLFVELVRQLGRPPDIVFVPTGVGGLAAGAVLALDDLAPRARVVTVEPSAANAVQASLAAGRPVGVSDRFTMLAGLRCQSVSAAAWPLLRHRVAAAIAVRDDDAAAAMRALAASRVVAGESGAAGLAGARIALARPETRARLRIDATSVVVTISTEGATDRANYERIVGARAASGAS